MSEINVTSIVRATRANPTRFSASIAETGNPQIGRDTYRAATRQRAFALTDEQQQEWRDYLPEYGAWEEDEIAEWSPAELTGLFVQFVSGDYRNLCAIAAGLGYDPDALTDEQFRECTENEGGALFSHGGEWFYYVGS